MTTRTPATTVRWRVETKDRTGSWVKRGLFETRSVARYIAGLYRDEKGYGFGNTRVIRYVPGERRFVNATFVTPKTLTLFDAKAAHKAFKDVTGKGSEK